MYAKSCTLTHISFLLFFPKVANVKAIAAGLLTCIFSFKKNLFRPSHLYSNETVAGKKTNGKSQYTYSSGNCCRLTLHSLLIIDFSSINQHCVGKCNFLLIITAKANVIFQAIRYSLAAASAAAVGAAITVHLAYEY